MTELSIIKLFIKDKAIYNKYYKYISSSIDKEIKNIILSIKDYYNKYEHHDFISIDELETFFFHVYPHIKEKQIYEDLFKRIEELDISDSLATDVIRKLIEKDYANKIIHRLTPLLTDSSFGVLPDVKKDIEEYLEVVSLKEEEESPFIEEELDDLIQAEVLDDGIKWRLNCLNADIGPLRGGSLGHVFSRPDTGKTTFFSSEVSYFATQLKEEDCILWFNNEEKGSKVKLRTYSSMLNSPLATIVINTDTAKEEYIKRGGNKIKVFDSAYITIDEIRKQVQLHNPKIVVIDQGDKILFRGGRDLSNTDRLKALYQMFREIAKEFNVDIITAGQASGEAHGKKWLEFIHMDNSKTGKPGELDYAIGIGKTFEEGSEEVRYINICKNKMKEGAHGKHTSLIDTHRARYKDI